MLIGYILFSFVITLVMSFIWSSNGLANCLIKTVFVTHAIFSIVMFLAWVQPLIETGSMKLI
jgi:hypothetical protein